MNKLLSVIVPTRDPDRPLARLLDSIADQDLSLVEEVLVVLDAFEMTIAARVRIEETVRPYPFVTLESLDAGRHTWGHDQNNWGVGRARGQYLLFNDDDDVFVPGAFRVIGDVVYRVFGYGDRHCPLVFRYVTPEGEVLPPRDAIEYQRIGGHAVVFPNVPGTMGHWSSRYEGDYDWIVSTLAKHPEWTSVIVYDPTIIALCRPIGEVQRRPRTMLYGPDETSA